MPIPIEIRLEKATQVLEVAFDDGAKFSLPAEYLRVESPSAEVQGHGPGGKQIVPGRRYVGRPSLPDVRPAALPHGRYVLWCRCCHRPLRDTRPR